MIQELYPGKCHIVNYYICSVSKLKLILLLHILGLDKVPRFLSDTMLPTSSPERTMEATVLVNGGYDPCHYEVNFCSKNIEKPHMKL